MTKRKGSLMEPGDEGSENEALQTGDLSASPIMQAEGYNPATQSASGLKPKIDSIFSEVEKNLPDIDFDLSDVSDDIEEPIIFSHHLKSTLYDDDKDLDTSEDSDSVLTAYSKISYDTLSDPETLGKKSNDIKAESDQMLDNDLAYKYQQIGKPVPSTWAEISQKDNGGDKNVENDKPLKLVQNWISESGVQTDPELDSSVQKNEDREVENQSRELSGSVSKEEKEKAGIESVSTGSLVESADKRTKRLIEREVKRTAEKDMVTNVISSRAPILSKHPLDNIDLDTVLQSLNEDNQLGPPKPRSAWSADRQSAEVKYGAGEGSPVAKNGGSVSGDGLTLIQRLARMAMEQDGEDWTEIDPCTGAARSEEGETNICEPVENSQTMSDKGEPERWADIVTARKPEEPKVTTASCGTNTNDFEPRILTPRVTPWESTSTTEEKNKADTVFIDLRNFEQLKQEQKESIEKVQKILGIQQNGAADSSDDDSEEESSWLEQRKKLKQNLACRGVTTETLPNKPKPIPHRAPQRVINMLNQRPSTQPSQRSEVTEGEEESSEVRAQREQQLREEREKERRLEVARKLREEREQERQARLRLAKRLEALKPTASVNGKQDAAEATPVIYDIEASYEPAPRTLPAILSSDQECLLLTIHLSSNGEIILHRGKSNKSVDTGTGLSASYTSLLTWLLALVPDNFAYLQENASQPDPVPWILPFNVIGLQQMVVDEQLCLMVAITPVEQFDAKFAPSKQKKSKLKDEVKDSSPFQQHIIKFLSTNTLHSVCPWLQNMISIEVPCMQTEDGSEKCLYTYRPPLPNITTKPLSTFMQINPDPQAACKVFNTSVGFFWQTIDNDEGCLLQNVNDKDIFYDTQDTMSLIYKKIFKEPSAMMGIFNRILQEGLDLAAVRLLYPTPELLNIPSNQKLEAVDNSQAQSELELLNNIGPVLAVGIRGTLARTIWLDAVGPSDPALARRTDPNSLCALYGGSSRDECLLFCPRNASRVQAELARWFGGRVPPGGVIDVGTPYTRKDHLRTGSPKGRRNKRVTFADQQEARSEPAPGSRPPATLSATTKSEIFLVFSPLVPPKCFGLILSTCQRRGFQIRGVRRCRLSNKRAASLGITGSVMQAFCPGASGTSESNAGFDDVFAEHVDPQKHGKQQEAASPSTILQLQKENASHSAASLIEACMVQMSLQGIMGEVQGNESYPLESRHMFHAARFSEGLLTTLGGDFSKCFDPEIQISPSFVTPALYTNPEVEQIAILLLCGHDVLKTCGLFIGKILNVMPYSKTAQILPFKEGFELLGLKWVPALTPTQAKEVTPYEAGDRLWKDNLHTLTTEPAVALALRGVNAFARLGSIIPSHPTADRGGKVTHFDMLLSRSAEEAYAFARLFFMERELFSDHQARTLLPYLPSTLSHGTEQDPSRKKKSKLFSRNNMLDECIFEVMLSGPKPITTFLLIKPRATQRYLSKILKKIVHEGFSVIAMKMQILTKDQASVLITESSQTVDAMKATEYLQSGASVCLCLERENAVKKLLDIMGPEDPQSARRQSQFYFRGVFGADTIANGFHCPRNYVEAVSDLKLFFPDGLCCQTTEELTFEQIVCPALDSEINGKFLDLREVTLKEKEHHDGEPVDPHELLMQTTCIVLSPALMKKLGQHVGFVEIIDGLVEQGFEFGGCRLIWFTQELAEQFLHLIDAGSYQKLPMLTSGPSLVLALQRDNAVVAFDSLMGGNLGESSLLNMYDAHILRPAHVKQAHQLLAFFFEKLLPSCQVQIVPKSFVTQ